MNKSVYFKFSQAALFGVLAFGVAVSVGCNSNKSPERHNQPNIEIIQDMMEQPALKAQGHEPDDYNKGTSRIPPEGTTPVGFTQYEYHNNPEAAAKALKNPLSGNTSPEILSLGQRKFETYCAVCHGYQGKGDGPVSVKMALKPPPLVSEKITGYPDGHIFHIITDGQGVMSSYAYQLVDPNDRWAIVQYVRNLQRLANAK